MNLDAELVQLENAHLVRRLRDEEWAYSFRHSLTHDAAYQSLLQRQRREIHRHVAQAYEQLFPEQLDENSTLLAQHYAQAGDDEKTVEYSIKAAQAAVRLYAYPEARGQLERALNTSKRLPDTEENRRRRVDAIFWYVEVAWGAFNPDELLGLVSEAESLAKSLGDPLRLVQIHTRLTALYLARGEYLQVNRYARQTLDEASRLDDKILMATPAAQLGIALVAQGRFAEAIPYLAQAITPLEQTPDRWEWFGSLASLGTALAMGGQTEKSMAEVERALTQVEATQNGFGITQTRVFLLTICLEQGDMPRLLVESERTMQFAVKSDMAWHASFALGLKALAQSRLGQPEDALATMDASRALGARVGSQLMFSDWLAAATAEIAYNAGRMQQAIALAEQTIALARSFDGIFAEGWAQRVWAQALIKLGPPRGDAAEEHFAESLRLFEAGNARLEAARTQVAWGKVLCERGDAESAREHFDQAAAQFQAAGLTRELEETQRLSRST